MQPTDTPQNWPDLAIGLYDRLTGRGAEITYAFDKMEVLVPSAAADERPRARWVLNGALRISTRNRND